ncbi:hypothetical protein [Burkholderia gladioli]|uniref:hypothetical protein n=1 Tax=Burkholderia gladioli TaxID=28095 RepID=UPI001FC7D502|nr:hypothetical protein [Burkholderia gladioli]
MRRGIGKTRSPKRIVFGTRPSTSGITSNPISPPTSKRRLGGCWNGLGATGAPRITDFIDQHAGTLGYLSRLALVPRRQFAPGDAALRPLARVGADVVPLEALRVPAALDGSAGLNRAPVPAHQVEMNTDLQAVNAWIAVRGARSAQTQCAYRREAERLLLWAIVAKGKPLSSLNTLDVAEYLEQFLANPQPAERWVGRGRVERFDPAWRPFAGPLSARSRDTARRILTAMGAWLVRQQYLHVNPFEGLAAAAPVPIDTAGRRPLCRWSSSRPTCSTARSTIWSRRSRLRPSGTSACRKAMRGRSSVAKHGAGEVAHLHATSPAASGVWRWD